jgi:hypothetical protein
MDGTQGAEAANGPAILLLVAGLGAWRQQQAAGNGEQDRRLVQLWHNGTLGKKRRQ